MNNLKDTPTFKSLMALSQDFVSEKTFADRHYPEDFKFSMHPTLEEVMVEFSAYRGAVRKMMRLWAQFADEIDLVIGNAEIKPEGLLALQATMDSMHQKFDGIQSSLRAEQKYQKEVWSIQEAAAEMNYSVKTLQNKISNWKKEGTKLPWLIDEEGSVSRVRVKEFMDFLKGKKKAGRPVKELE